MGLKEIIEEINKDGELETASILNDAKVKTGQLLMKKQEELDSQYTRKRELLEEEMSRLRKKLFAKAELDEQRERYRLRHEQVESLLQSSFEDIISWFKEHPQDYAKYISDAVLSSEKELGSTDLKVCLNADDQHLFESIKKKVKAKIHLGEPALIRGGVVCYHGREMVDHSLGVIFQQLRPLIIQYIDQELQAVEG